MAELLEVRAAPPHHINFRKGAEGFACVLFVLPHPVPLLPCLLASALAYSVCLALSGYNITHIWKEVNTIF